MSLSRGAALAGLLALAPGLSGCVTVAVAGASQGIEYTITNIAHRTYTAPMDAVHSATWTALKRMQIKCPAECERKTPNGYKFKAETAKLDITVTLTKVTPKATRIAVNARENFFIKDKAVAFEVINQVGLAMGLQ
ncbi:MAG: DUF3568 family protein [Elusimicrobia bacterium]|nr:DUF3568 family protein [Elusimicrobiota bacterium]